MHCRGPQAWDQSRSFKAQARDHISGPTTLNSSALVNCYEWVVNRLPKESNLGSCVKPVLVVREENKELVYNTCETHKCGCNIVSQTKGERAERKCC